MKEQSQRSKNNASHEPSILPATEIAQNPNPRANENIKDKISNTETKDTNASDTVGSEVTDGEDG